jgi:hypothetical protein
VKKTNTPTRTRSSPAPLQLSGNGRRATRQSRGAPSNEAALHVLLSKTIEFLVSAGESPEKIMLELKGQVERVRGRQRGWRANDAKHLKDSYKDRIETSGLIHDWHREPAYTNQDGDPVQLTERSLRALVGKRFPRQQISAAVRRMYEYGLIRKTNRGKIALTGGRQVLYIMKKRGRAVVFERAANLVPQYLRTALHNASTEDPYSRDIDRDARILYLPEKYVPLWREVVRERARVFLEGVDNWLEDHACRDDTGPVHEVAVHCYAYTGDSRSPKIASVSTLHPKRDRDSQRTPRK